jgi:phosphate-selective porin OprO and OprP
VAATNPTPPPAAAGGMNPAPHPTKPLRWEFAWRGWDGLHLEAIQQTPLTNRLDSVAILPASANPFGSLHLEQLKLNGTFGARVEVDGAAFLTSGNLTDFDAGVQLRRLRLFAGGDCILILPVSYFVELGYSADQFTLNQSYLLFSNIGLIGNLQVGQFQPPMGLELITSSRDLTFMEPSAALQAIAPGIEAGVQIGQPIFHDRATWALGLFVPGAGGIDYGNASSSFGSAVGRFTCLPIYHTDPDHPSGNRLLHLGLSANIAYSASSTLRYQSRPESHIAPYVVDTGDIAATSAGTVGAEMAWVNGPLCLQGELIQSVVSEQSGGSANLGGFYAFASWYLTGESRPYDTQAGAFKRLIPRHNFNFGHGGWGAMELTCRFSHTDLTEGNVHGGRLNLLMAGVNWHLTPHVKWMFNYGFGRVTSSPSQGYMNIFQTRVGVDF